MKNLMKLIQDAELNLWSIRGKGLGAVLLTIIALAVIGHPNFGVANLVNIYGEFKK